jgi:hypothetical protein
MSERVAIVGTAPSWKETPWNDVGLKVYSLNDAYRMPGFARADAWFDFHPIDKFHFHDGSPLYAHQVPVGYYVRPANHVQWLAEQAKTIPVYLHPDYLAQHPDATNWPHARPFPKAQIEAEFGRYFTSSPAWMIALAVMQGVRELHIYGIHLSTEHEYIEQRPNFEFLIGRVLGPKKITVRVADGLRRYETADGMVVLPEASPILNSPFQYAFETRPRQALEPLKWDLHKVQVKTNRQMQRLVDRRFWQRKGPMVEELARLQVWSQDISEQMQRIERGF